MDRRDFIAGAVVTTVAASLPASAWGQAAGTQPLVRLGVIGISFHAVVGGVAQIMLEDLGARVEITQAPHDQMFQRLAAGEVDLLVTAWMPNTHIHLFTPIADRIQPIATAYSDARLYWSVPSYVPADMVSSVEDLLKPEVAQRMDKTIRSIGPSAGLSVRSLRMVPEYGLAAAGYSVVPGETADWVRNFREGYAANRWMVMPLWQPQFLNKTHAVRILRDPKGVMGAADDAVIVANRAFMDRLPAPVLASLRNLSIGLDGVTEMDLAVNTRGMTALDAARQWMTANADRVARWRATG